MQLLIINEYVDSLQIDRYEGDEYDHGDNEVRQETELSELLQIRRTNWTSFEHLGIDPFGRNSKRTHHAEDILEQV